MYRRLSGRLFHIPMIIVVSLHAALAGVLFLTGRDYGVALVFLIVAVLFYVSYGFYVVPRIYTGPAARLVEGVQALARGDARITWGTGFRGELLDLRMALESLVGTLRGAGNFGNPGVSQSPSKPRPPMSLETLASLLSGPAQAVTEALERVAAGSGADGKPAALPALGEALECSRECLRITENLREMSRLEKAGAPLPGEFWFSDLIKEIEREAAALAGVCGPTLITACDDSLRSRQLRTDRACLKGLLTALIKEGLAACGEGTVTVLGSLQQRDGSDYLELCIACAVRQPEAEGGRRSSPEALPLHPESTAVFLAGMSCDFLGGSMELEGSPGEGSVLTLVAPA